jgi:hypothetical protein
MSRKKRKKNSIFCMFGSDANSLSFSKVTHDNSASSADSICVEPQRARRGAENSKPT